MFTVFEEISIKGVSRAFQGLIRFEGISSMLQLKEKSFKHVSRKFKGCFKESLMGVSRKFQRKLHGKF